MDWTNRFAGKVPSKYREKSIFKRLLRSWVLNKMVKFKKKKKKRSQPFLMLAFKIFLLVKMKMKKKRKRWFGIVKKKIYS